ncbi:MAG: RNA polymerase sigma factor [Chitinophagales bacterium]
MNQTEFDKLFHEAHGYCIGYLIKITHSKADAEDVFMDAIAMFWVLYKKGKIKEKSNLKAYIATIAKRLWFEKKRKEEKHKEYSQPPKVVEQQAEANIEINGFAVFDLLIKAETEQANNAQLQARKKSFNAVFRTLGKKCQQLLMSTIVYKIKMKELMGTLGYGSVQTVKDAKYRCKKILLKKLQEINLRTNG